MMGPSGRYILAGTLRTLYAPPSRSVGPAGSAEGGRLCIDAEDGGGPGEWERIGADVGVTFEATRQYSSKLSEMKH